MASRRDRPFSTNGRDDSDANDIESIFAEYIERLNAGEKISPWQIEKEHPAYASELIEQLEIFQNSLVNGQDSMQLGILGDYTLRRQIGRGGMGVVYEAWENSMGRPVALKVLPAGLAADRRAAARFMREAQAAGQLTHPNVVSVHAMGVYENTPYYSMEYVEGETLAQIVAKVREGEPEAETVFGKKDSVVYFGKLAEAFSEVADGLQHAHSKGVIHRDVKPSNLILDSEGRLRILDFGLARLEGQESLTISGDLVGTPLYMSPEQARARKVPIDHRTDVYSLGATMYEMLTWRPPFKGKDYQDTLSQIVERDPVEPKKLNQPVPRDLETIVLKCLRKEPEDRYATAEAVGQDLRRCARGDPIEARPQSTWEKIGRRLWRQRWRLLTAASIGFLVLLSGILLIEDHAEKSRADLDNYRVVMEQAVLELQRFTLLSHEAMADVDLLDPMVAAAVRYWPSNVFSRYGFDPSGKLLAALTAEAAQIDDRPEAHYYKARALLLSESEAEALRALEQALQVDPDFVPARYLKIRLLRRNGEKAGSEEDRLNMHGPATWQGEWLAAFRALGSLRWEAAADAFQKLLSRQKESGEVYFGARIECRLGWGKASLGTQDYSSAIENFILARDSWPDAIEPALLLGKACYLAGESSRQWAEDTFLDLHRKMPDRDDIPLWVAALYFSLEAPDDAVRWVKRIEDSLLRSCFEAAALCSKRQYRDALSLAQHALSIDGECPNAHVVLGMALEGLSRVGPIVERPRCREGARDAYQRSIGLDPNFVPGYTALGKLLSRQDPWEDGYKLLLKATEMDPKYVPAWCDRGEVLLQRGRWTETIELFNEALTHFPTNAFYHTALGHALTELGQYGEAIEKHRRAIRLNPRLAAAYAHLGITRLRQGEFCKAIEAFRKTLELRSDARSPYDELIGLLSRDERIDCSGELTGLADGLQTQLDSNGEHPFRRLAAETLVLAYRHLPPEEKPRRSLAAADQGLPTGSGNRDFRSLVLRSKILFETGQGADAVRTLEKACRMPRGFRNGRTAWFLEEQLRDYREAIHPDLVSFEGVDAALDALDTETVVRRGATWRYLPGTAEPPPEPFPWTDLDFDDRAWKEGPSGFGYGDGDDATVLQGMRGGYTSLYIRHRFEIDARERYTHFLLRVYADDGFVAYLNGEEIGHMHVDRKPEEVPHYAVATQRSHEPLMPTEIRLPPESLAAGPNVLALQGLNAPAEDLEYPSDFSLIPTLEGRLPPDGARDRRLVAEVRPFVEGLESASLLTYLEGRVLQREAKYDEAAAKFEALTELKGPEPEPYLRLGEVFLELGDAERASAALRSGLENTNQPRRELWERWVTVSFTRLGRTPADMLEDLPRPQREPPTERTTSAPTYEMSLRWLLERLANDEDLRIHCGANANYIGTGNTTWSKDRFFTSGGFYRPRTSEPEVEGTEDDPLYWRGRFFSQASREPGYRIPLPPGQYRVALHFAEVIFGIEQKGRNEFGVKVEGKTLCGDCLPTVGVAVEHSDEFPIQDGMLNIDLLRSPGKRRWLFSAGRKPYRRGCALGWFGGGL